MNNSQSPNGSADPGCADEFNRARQQDCVTRIWSRDASLWSDDPKVIASIENRLGWLDASEWLAQHHDELEVFREQTIHAGLTQVVLLGMGGSSLAPELFAKMTRHLRPRLDIVVLDNTHPDMIDSVWAQVDPARCLFIVSSKSGGTIETDCFRRIFFDRMIHSVEKAGDHFVAITDAGSELERTAQIDGYRRIFLNPADIGGRFSAFSYFGAVPGVLAGLDLRLLARKVTQATTSCRDDSEATGVVLGVKMATCARNSVNKLILELPDQLCEFGAWIEQLIAESTGKQRSGIVPVPANRSQAAISGPDILRVVFGANRDADTDKDTIMPHCEDVYDVAAEMFHWAFGTALYGALMGINPFDEPDVTVSKNKTAEVLSAGVDSAKASAGLWTLQRNGYRILCDSGCGVENILCVLDWLKSDGYLSVLTYLPDNSDNRRIKDRLKDQLWRRLQRPVSVIDGPRYLHSTGQLYKGGPDQGVFILVGQSKDGVAVPGRDYTIGELNRSQILGDYLALRDRNRPAVIVEIDAPSDFENVLTDLGGTAI